MKHTPVDIAVAKGYDNLVHALGGRSTSLQRLNSTEHLFHLIRNHPANQSIWSTPPLFYVMHECNGYIYIICEWSEFV